MVKTVASAEDLIKKHEDGPAWENGPPATWKVYRDTKGNPTIGWGHKLPKTTTITEITNNQADAYFADDYSKAAEDAADFVNNFGSLSSARQAVLIDMRFNLGKAGLEEFENLKTALESSNWDNAVKEMKDSSWYRQTGKRAKEDVAIMGSGSF